MPLKGNFFMWCTLDKKTPTWDIMKKRSLEGLGWCSLCKNDEETTNHLFLNCPFSTQVWQRSQAKANHRFSWSGPSLEEAWKTWLNTPQLSHIKSLPLIHIWGVWIARNH